MKNRLIEDIYDFNKKLMFNNENDNFYVSDDLKITLLIIGYSYFWKISNEEFTVFI
jgi:hypothetical protein